MGNRVLTMLVLVAVCAGFAVSPTQASESRVAGFTIPCDGTPHEDSFFVTSLGNAKSRFIQGAELILLEKNDGLQYLFLSIEHDRNKVLIGMSSGETRTARDFTGFFASKTDTKGNMTFNVSGQCKAEFGKIQGYALIHFFS